jgi:hypothetical protein
MEAQQDTQGTLDLQELPVIPVTLGRREMHQQLRAIPVTLVHQVVKAALDLLVLPGTPDIKGFRDQLATLDLQDHKEYKELQDILATPVILEELDIQDILEIKVQPATLVILVHQARKGLQGIPVIAVKQAIRVTPDRKEVKGVPAIQDLQDLSELHQL